MAARWYRRLWGSLYEPRAVTALMVAIYALVIVYAVLALCEQRGPLDVATGFASVFMAVGGLVGLPAAWRGAWWAEGPAAASTVAGLAMLTALDLVDRTATARLPVLSLVLLLVLVLFFTTRVIRVWPRLYAPGRGIDPVRDAEVRADAAQALADQAAERVRAHRHPQE